MPAGPRIRRARGHEAAALGGLAMRSKAHWGYDAAFMAACRAELDLTPGEVAESPVFPCEANGAILGQHSQSADSAARPRARGRSLGLRAGRRGPYLAERRP